MQDVNGVPSIVRLRHHAREAVGRDLGGDPEKGNLCTRRSRDDHDGDRRSSGPRTRSSANVADRIRTANGERYQFLRWGQGAFNYFTVVRQAPLSSPGQPEFPGERCDGARRRRIIRDTCRGTR